MAYLSLYRKWRPATFSDVLGQAHVTETLTGALREGRVAHAYLFAGPRGTGKTSTARILAKALNCERGVSPEPCGECSACRETAEGTALDVFEMDAASHTSVDDVREIRERIPFAAAAGGHKVYIIDEAHQLSNPAFNALLKMLEEPPPHVVFVLCTTEAQKLPATVVSRCQRFEFRRLGGAEIADHLARVAEQEKISTEEGAFALIARHARGSVRDALSLLDQAAASADDGPVRRETILEILGEAPEDLLLELCAAIADGNVPAAFTEVDQMVERGWDPRHVLRQLLDQLRSFLLASHGAGDLVEADPAERAKVAELAGRFTTAHLEWALRVLGEAQADVRWSTHPRLTLEVALARAACLEGDDSRTLLARIERLERLVLSLGGQPQGTPVPPDEPPAKAVQRPSRKPVPPVSEQPTQPLETPVVVQPDPPVAEEPAADDEPTETMPSVVGPLDEQWAAFLESVRTQSRVTYTHLKEGWPISVADGALVVGFDTKFHADELSQRPQHTARITSALERVFGQRLRLRPEVHPGGRPGGGRSVAAEAASPVDLVMRGLGAEVVEEVEH